jgi:hypothetical protein
MRPISPAPAVILLAVVLGLTAAPLAGQDARLASRLAPGTRLAVERLVDSARTAGGPTEPLIRKALEGASKGADSARIIAAVAALARHLGQAREALGPTAEEAELIAGAAALRAGAPAARLRALDSLRPRERLAVPLSVLADLLTSGIEPERAWTTVRDMASRGAPDAAFLTLRDRMAGSRGAASTDLPPQAERPPAATPLPAPSRPAP